MSKFAITTKHIASLLSYCVLAFWTSLSAGASSDTSASSASPHKLLQINTPRPEKSSQEHGLYFIKLLELALEKTEPTDGPFLITQATNNYTSNRQITELARANGAINVIWTSDSKQREDILLPVKISILKGLNSYRVFLIRKDDQEKFHKIHSLKELSQLTAGQGAQWPDTQVMVDNGLPVVTAAQSDLLFDMLAGKRFEYFPRGLYEVWGEQKLNAYRGLVVEDSLMFHYPSPIYFFVNKNNHALADRIERGLNLAIQDGSFDKLFFNIPGFKQGYEELHNPARQLIELKTDFLTED